MVKNLLTGYGLYEGFKSYLISYGPPISCEASEKFKTIAYLMH